jgi:hypothetical protein
VLAGQLGEGGDDARVDPAGLEVGDPVGVELQVLVLEQRGRLGGERAAAPRLPELGRVDGGALAAGLGVGDAGGCAAALA